MFLIFFKKKKRYITKKERTFIGSLFLSFV
jgi:hypothetical protein